jgi:hypothetical protein
VGGLLDHDLFVAVDVATARLTSEVRTATASPELLGAWEVYHFALEAMRQSPNLEGAEAVRSAIGVWQATLAAAQWAPRIIVRTGIDRGAAI